jgi:hypothetical protein
MNNQQTDLSGCEPETNDLCGQHTVDLWTQNVAHIESYIARCSPTIHRDQAGWRWAILVMNESQPLRRRDSIVRFFKINCSFKVSGCICGEKIARCLEGFACNIPPLHNFANMIGWIQSITMSPPPITPAYWRDAFVNLGPFATNRKADH